MPAPEFEFELQDVEVLLYPAIQRVLLLYVTYLSLLLRQLLLELLGVLLDLGKLPREVYNVEERSQVVSVVVGVLSVMLASENQHVN